ncbi:hypothetical protein BCR44DRAFT_1514722 [Catenaria anguillulae PL171]|uniref:Pre-mRNA-splicing factor CWC24 n=1 Tax=Catenaria anguillulae PL171 TaxID=765915 RepID=A0A1Y2HG47_9FUNG|nr:hypothetical protein BCR44DRAFT_1514722 [Catenaria anguillulae PL171]
MFKKAGSAAKPKKRSHSDDDDAQNDQDDEPESTTIHKRQRTSGPSMASVSDKSSDPTLADLTRLVASSKSSRPSKPDLKVTYASSTSASSSSSSSSTFAADAATRTMDIDGPTRPNPTNSNSRIGPQHYKQTGFCGYGDSCKFLHDRGDYKSGWQLDKDWDANQQARREAERVALLNADAEEVQEEKVDEVDELPFACFICRGEFKRPVVTKCGHYFCEACVVERAKKGMGKCAACGEQTGGIVKPAKELMAKLEERKKRMQEMEEDARKKNEEQEED